MSSPEHLPSSGERGLEAAGDAARERQAELLQTGETIENAHDRHESLASARKEAHEIAVSVERPHGETGTNASGASVIRPRNNRQSREKAYKDILRHTQNELPPVSRIFSKVIHNPLIDRTSAVMGATVARPNAILFGALFALIVSGGVYAIAKYYGYALSGFEAIGAFVIGWAVGLLIDFIRLAFAKR